MTPPVAPENLLKGVRELGSLDGCEVLDAPRWFDKPGVWAVPIALSGYEAGEEIPARTCWWLTAAATYPRGSINVYPAYQGGLHVTFPHQRHNKRNPDLPWMTGELCLTFPEADMPIHGNRRPPRDPVSLLRWHIERALAWLTHAGRRTLLAHGHPFELPDYDPRTSDRLGTVVVCEGDDALERWSAIPSQWGLVDFATIPLGKGNRTIATRFTLPNGTPIWQPPWGETLRNTTGTVHRGAWLWTTTPVILRPWQAPQRWGELRQAARVPIDNALDQISARFRGRRDTLLLLGHALPERVGGPMRQVAWQALRLPPLPTRARLPSRLHKVSLSAIDRANALADHRPIAWQKTDNWARERLASRGSLPSCWRTRMITLLGAGTLGSHIAEFLVRAGAGFLTILDDDTAEVGNLVRHVLTLHDLGQDKTTPVGACRLLEPRVPGASGRRSPIRCDCDPRGRTDCGARPTTAPAPGIRTSN